MRRHSKPKGDDAMVPSARTRLSEGPALRLLRGRVVVLLRCCGMRAGVAAFSCSERDAPAGVAAPLAWTTAPGRPVNLQKAGGSVGKAYVEAVGAHESNGDRLRAALQGVHLYRLAHVTRGEIVDVSGISATCSLATASGGGFALPMIVVLIGFLLSRRCRSGTCWCYGASWADVVALPTTTNKRVAEYPWL